MSGWMKFLVCGGYNEHKGTRCLVLKEVHPSGNEVPFAQIPLGLLREALAADPTPISISAHATKVCALRAEHGYPKSPVITRPILGVACPDCYHELFDMDPPVFPRSDPPTRILMCSHCGHSVRVFT